VNTCPAAGISYGGIGVRSHLEYALSVFCSSVCVNLTSFVPESLRFSSLFRGRFPGTPPLENVAASRQWWGICMAITSPGGTLPIEANFLQVPVLGCR
jgi:hypothetical protein